MADKNVEYGTVTFTGSSGTEYDFKAVSWDYDFNDVGAVYFITNRHENADGGYSHTRIYVGETGDLSTRFDDHHKKDCFEENNANCKCIYLESDEDTRLEIEKDLKDNYNPPCNG